MERSCARARGSHLYALRQARSTEACQRRLVKRHGRPFQPATVRRVALLRRRGETVIQSKHERFDLGSRCVATLPLGLFSLFSLLSLITFPFPSTSFRQDATKVLLSCDPGRVDPHRLRPGPPRARQFGPADDSARRPHVRALRRVERERGLLRDYGPQRPVRDRQEEGEDAVRDCVRRRDLGLKRILCSSTITVYSLHRAKMTLCSPSTSLKVTHPRLSLLRLIWTFSAEFTPKHPQYPSIRLSLHTLSLSCLFLSCLLIALSCPALFLLCTGCLVARC